MQERITFHFPQGVTKSWPPKKTYWDSHKISGIRYSDNMKISSVVWYKNVEAVTKSYFHCDFESYFVAPVSV